MTIALVRMFSGAKVLYELWCPSLLTQSHTDRPSLSVNQSGVKPFCTILDYNSTVQLHSLTLICVLSVMIICLMVDKMATSKLISIQQIFILKQQFTLSWRAMSEGNDQHRLCTRGSAVAGICASWAGWIATTIRALTFRSPQSGTELMRDGGDSWTPQQPLSSKCIFLQ